MATVFKPTACRVGTRELYPVSYPEEIGRIRNEQKSFLGRPRTSLQCAVFYLKAHRGAGPVRWCREERGTALQVDHLDSLKDGALPPAPCRARLFV